MWFALEIHPQRLEEPKGGTHIRVESALVSPEVQGECPLSPTLTRPAVGGRFAGGAPWVSGRIRVSILSLLFNGSSLTVQVYPPFEKHNVTSDPVSQDVASLALLGEPV